MSLLTALLVKNSHIFTGIYFILLKKRPRLKLKAFQYQILTSVKSSYQALCKFLILIIRKKKLITGKNLLVLSKSFLVAIARIWDSLRFSVSQKAFYKGKFWLILSKNFLDLGMEFVYEKMTTYKIVSPRKSIFSIFSTLKQSYNKPYKQFFYKRQINSVQL